MILLFCFVANGVGLASFAILIILVEFVVMIIWFRFLNIALFSLLLVSISVGNLSLVSKRPCSFVKQYLN